MFDRLYRLKIRHSDLDGGSLTIEGDSAEPSLGLDFSVSINQSYVAANGRVTIYGLTKEHIDLLSAIRRYEYPKNAERKNTVTLAVGWRDCVTGAVSKYTVILHGTIIEAIPGPLPDRSLTMTVFRSALKTVIPAGDEVIFKSPPAATAETANGVDAYKWLSAAAEYVNSLGTDYEVIVYDEFASFPKFENAPYPKTLQEFKEVAAKKGAVVSEVSVSQVMPAGEDNAEEKAQMTTLVEIRGDAAEASGAIEVSQRTGMIGIPTSIQMGAQVDVVLKDIIQPGSFVNLQTKMFPKLSSDSERYTNGGIYRVMSNTISGQFLGETWKQTLVLNRGGSILKNQ